ncbi:Pvc16 family protein [Geobacter sp.]|uniref:Pvc16 family protein n=1 Tax=Geobacter sp. TaxID=46610 RepID=UPI002616FA63|nr:Pvc16 family protein [Geobacter sp.]
MIRDLSQTLRAILSQPGLPAELAAARIAFDRPTEQFNPQQTTVDLFLYDVRENVELRSSEPVVERAGGEAVIRRPPLRVACSYLVTAWPVGGTEPALQEHRLLSQVLQVLSRYPIIPPAFLQGGLAGQEPPLPMVAALVDRQKNLSEFWTALGNRLRPSLTVTVTIGIDVFTPETVPMVLTGEVLLGERTAPHETTLKAGTEVRSFRIGGRVTGTGDAPVAGATVTLVERGISATSDGDGRFVLGAMKPGSYTLHVVKGGTVKDVAITVPAPGGQNYDVQLT